MVISIITCVAVALSSSHNSIIVGAASLGNTRLAKLRRPIVNAAWQRLLLLLQPQHSVSTADQCEIKFGLNGRCLHSMAEGSSEMDLLQIRFQLVKKQVARGMA